ncbi:hypothetical protein TNCV_773571 [Trichonephila clavipes]|nr:hypothetical protein TNCV_773571 [Trichonephila clavipes]
MTDWELLFSRDCQKYKECRARFSSHLVRQPAFVVLHTERSRSTRYYSLSESLFLHIEDAAVGSGGNSVFYSFRDAKLIETAHEEVVGRHLEGYLSIHFFLIDFIKESFTFELIGYGNV